MTPAVAARPISLVAVLALVTSVQACNQNSTTAPSSNGSGGTASVSVSGTVTDASSAAPIASAAVAVQGKSTTTGTDGRYTIADLTAGSAQLTAQHQGHQNFSQAVTLAGAMTVNVAMTPDPAAAYAGNWTGQWVNTTFGTTGGATMVVSVDTIAQTFEATVDLNGLVFGVADPPPQTFGGPYTDSGANVTVTSPTLGDVTLSIDAAGAITGNAINVPGGFIARVDFTGTATASTIIVNYTITFTGGGTAQGVLTLNKS